MAWLIDEGGGGSYLNAKPLTTSRIALYKALGLWRLSNRPGATVDHGNWILFDQRIRSEALPCSRKCLVGRRISRRVASISSGLAARHQLWAVAVRPGHCKTLIERLEHDAKSVHE